MRTEEVAAAFRTRAPALGCWSVTDSPTALVIVNAATDFIAIDCQHSPLDASAAATLLRGRPGRTQPVLVRVSSHQAAEIGRVADAGAELIVVPMIQSTGDAEQALRAVRYPPAGGRSYGPFGVTAEGHLPRQIEEQVGIVAMIETAAALADVTAICSVPGLTGIYVGPADLSVSLGLDPMRAFDTDQLDDVLRDILAAARPHGLLAGIHSRSGEKAAAYARLGFDFVTVGSELQLLGQAVAAELARARAEAGAR